MFNPVNASIHLNSTSEPIWIPITRPVNDAIGYLIPQAPCENYDHLSVTTLNTTSTASPCACCGALLQRDKPLYKVVKDHDTNHMWITQNPGISVYLGKIRRPAAAGEDVDYVTVDGETLTVYTIGELSRYKPAIRHTRGLRGYSCIIEGDAPHVYEDVVPEVKPFALVYTTALGGTIQEKKLAGLSDYAGMLIYTNFLKDEPTSSSHNYKTGRELVELLGDRVVYHKKNIKNMNYGPDKNPRLNLVIFGAKK